MSLPYSTTIEFGEIKQREGSVTAKIDWYVVSERWYFFLQLQIGLPDLFMMVPRNYVIFSETTYQPILAVTDLWRDLRYLVFIFFLLLQNAFAYQSYLVLFVQLELCVSP